MGSSSSVLWAPKSLCLSFSDAAALPSFLPQASPALLSRPWVTAPVRSAYLRSSPRTCPLPEPPRSPACDGSPHCCGVPGVTCLLSGSLSSPIPMPTAGAWLPGYTFRSPLHVANTASCICGFLSGFLGPLGPAAPVVLLQMLRESQIVASLSRESAWELVFLLK